jgi:integration host factor subunit beta
MLFATEVDSCRIFETAGSFFRFLDLLSHGSVSAMTKADLVEEIANSTGLTKKDTALAVDHLIDAVKAALREGSHIEIRGFGTFKVKQRKARTARNPRTGDPVQLPPRKVAVFKVSKELKDRISQDGS